MTRNDVGGGDTLPKAWEQAEEFYLSLNPTPAPAAGTIVSGQISHAGKTTTLEGIKAERLLRLLHDLPPLVLASALLFSASSMMASPASAQTAIGGARQGVPTTPPGRSTTAQAQGAQSPQAQASSREMPNSAVLQAIEQQEGIFPLMERSGGGGQIQNAWDVSEKREGVYAVRMCEDCVYKVRTREMMTTTIVLPQDAVIVAADLGDNVGFQATTRFGNMLAIRPTTYGVDTNLNVYTKSGRVYPFYVRAETFNSIHVPDVMVRILGRETPENVVPAVSPSAAEATEGSTRGKVEVSALGDRRSVAAVAVENLTNPKPQNGDFVRNVPFDPAKLHGWSDYKLWGGGDAEKELKPVMVYRDDFFTYLNYGRKFDPLELPSAWIVRDGIDELVNSRVQGNTFIVESVNRLISIKSGKSFLCIEYTGETP